MMGALSTIDDFLIDRVFQPVSTWTEIHFGRTCFWLAWLCVGLSMAFYMVHLYVKFTFLGVPVISMDVVMGALVLTAMVCQLRKAQANCEKAFDRAMNPARVRPSDRIIRLIGALLAALSIAFRTGATVRGSAGAVEWIAEPWFVLSVASFYFSVCTPLPPSFLRTERAHAPSAS